MFTIAGVLLIAVVVFGADFVRHDGPRLLLVAIGIPLVLIPFVLISHAKTEGGWHWRWGPKN